MQLISIDMIENYQQIYVDKLKVMGNLEISVSVPSGDVPGNFQTGIVYHIWPHLTSGLIR